MSGAPVLPLPQDWRWAGTREGPADENAWEDGILWRGLPLGRARRGNGSMGAVGTLRTWELIGGARQGPRRLRAQGGGSFCLRGRGKHESM